MRVFKILTIFSLFIYVLCIVIDVIHDEWQAKIKFKYIYKDNLINNGQKRIVLYGSSHCDYGLSAREISKRTKIKTINLCNYGIERKRYFKKFKSELIGQLGENDILLYSFRLNIKKTELEEDGILGLLLPQIRIAILRFYKHLLDEKEVFDEFGDRIYYPRTERKFNYPKYEIKYDEINKHINMKIDDFKNDKNIKSKIIIAIVPILIDDEKKIDLNQIIYNCNINCENLIDFIQPSIITDKKYYNTIGAEHFNPELGRKLWTKLIIKNLIKNNIHN